MKHGIATVEEIGAFDTVIDVRSPAEFAEDNIPGALNHPVLDDAQRAEIGTIYTQDSPFAAKKIGAACVAENIARHLRESFAAHPKTWKPLICCWRGGERSAAMTHVLRRVGWNAHQLEGGYKSYRRMVLSQLQELPAGFNFIVISGVTGSGKSQILQAMARQGRQVLDLEALACHKGSVLGVLPDAQQPSQKRFESDLRLALLAFDPARPVYVEAESRKIGQIFLQDALLERIRAGTCVNIEASFAARVDFLLRDYAYFIESPGLLSERLDSLRGLQEGATLERWQVWAHGGQWRELVGELLARHYDPLYRRSQAKHFFARGQPRHFAVDDLSPPAIERLASRIAATFEAQ